MAQPIVALPNYVVLQSKPQGKYLRYVKEGGEEHGFVKFSADKVSIPEAKFEVEESTTQDGLVHLRSCYSNKYLVFENNWIVATAGQKEEDKTKTLCTLLKPTSVDGNSKQIRLFHVQREKYLWSWSHYAPYVGRVVADYSYLDPISYDVFNVIDWQSLVILPKYVVFKGDNGRFLQAHWQDNREFLKFSLCNVADDPRRAGHEIVENADGTIRIKNLHWGKFWRSSPNWIWADSTDTTSNNKDTVFQAVKLGGNFIALKCLGNNLFCSRFSVDFKDDCLNANSSFINAWNKLEVSQYTRSNDIEDIEFRLQNSRIYGENIQTVDNLEVYNYGEPTTETTMTMERTVKRVSTWNNSLSLTLGYHLTVGVSVPAIANGEIGYSAEISGTHEWGESNETEDTISKSFEITVQPNSSKSMKLLATQGKCDVPYSYTLVTSHYNGTTERVRMDDGIFTGVNCYNSQVEVSNDIPLDGEHKPKLVFTRIAC